MEALQSHMDNLRISFISGEQKKFINMVYKISGLSTNQLSILIKVHSRTLRDWRREKLTMSLLAAEIFCKKFNLNLPEDKNIMIERWRQNRKEANRIGGIARFKKHGSPATLEGRRKGGIKAVANLRKNGITPVYKIYNYPTFSDYLAEYSGIMLGDGGITSGQCTVTLNYEADRDYIDFVVGLSKKLFGEAPKMIKRKDSKACVIYYNGVSLVRYLVSIDLKVGNKVKQQVDVPDWVKINNKFRIACLRGLMDTDGGVFLHKYKANGRIYAYKKISFSNRSMPLLFFVKQTLEELGFTPKLIDNVVNKKVWLYNTNQVKKYLDLVGTHNTRLLK